MAYDKAEMEKKALTAIKKHKLVFASDVVTYLPCTEKTYYNLELHQLQSIKAALDEQRVAMKVKLRKRWLESENPTLNVALYKLIGSEEEAHRLNGSKQQMDVTSQGEKINSTFEVVVVGSMDKLPQSEDEIKEPK